MVDITKEVKRISEESGISEKDISEELAKLKGDGFDDEAAVCIYKSNIKNMLGGQIADNAALLPFSKEAARTVNTKNGAMKVATIHAFVNIGDRWDAKSMSFWGDDADSEPQKYEVGKVYAGKLKVRDDRVRVMGDLTASTKPAPDPKQIAKGVGIMDLSKVPELVGNSCFLEGIVGRYFTTQNGAGIELSAIGSNPVTVFLDGEQKVNVGDKVVVFGYISKGKGGVAVRGTLL